MLCHAVLAVWGFRVGYVPIPPTHQPLPRLIILALLAGADVPDAPDSAPKPVKRADIDKVLDKYALKKKHLTALFDKKINPNKLDELLGAVKKSSAMSGDLSQFPSFVKNLQFFLKYEFPFNIFEKTNFLDALNFVQIVRLFWKIRKNNFIFTNNFNFYSQLSKN